MYVHKKRRILSETKRRDYISTYIPHVTAALKELIGIKDVDKTEKLLKQILEKHRGQLEKIGVDNPDYDEELATFGKEEPEQEPAEEEPKGKEKQTKLTE